MFKTCSDPDFNWVHCLCDSATWVVKEPGKPIGFFYSRLFDAALEGKHAGCYSRDVDALVFTDDDIDDYANMIEHGRPDLDFIQCREIASQAVTDWNNGHAMDGFTEFLYDYANEHAPAKSVKQGGGIRH